MMRSWLFVVTMVLLGAGTAFAQTPAPAQPPNSTTLCPITHNCRPAGAGAHARPVVPPTMPVQGSIQCPPGTYQIPNTNKCRVK